MSQFPDSLLINLNIISKIAPNDKIFVNGEGYISIENSTIFQGLFRFFYSNGRSKSVHNLSNFYQHVFKFVDQSIAHNPPQCSEACVSKGALKTLGIYLQKSLSGVENLKQTYQTDVVITSKMDIIMDSIRQYAKKIDKYTTDVFEPSSVPSASRPAISSASPLSHVFG
jgi:hypothetical protein